MRVETTKKIILTEEEQRVIHDLYEIFNEDKIISTLDVWDILTDIYNGDDTIAKQYGYSIEIVG